MRGWASSKTTFWKSPVIQWIVSILPVKSYILWDSLNMDSEWTIAWPLTMLRYSRADVMPFLLGHISISYFSSLTLTKCPLYFTLLMQHFVNLAKLWLHYFCPTYIQMAEVPRYVQIEQYPQIRVCVLAPVHHTPERNTYQSGRLIYQHFVIKWDIQKLQKDTK